MSYQEFHRRSIEQPDAFWSEQAALIDWQRPFDQVLDYSRPPFARWFVGGYYFILGRTDDVINVARHRLGTREIEEAVSAHPAIAEAAVVGVADELKGQLPMAFAVVKNPAAIATRELREQLEKEVMDTVDESLGAIGRPCHVHFVTQLPKTRSGRVLRRSIKAIAEGHDPGDLTSLDDPRGIEQIERAVLAPVK